MTCTRTLRWPDPILPWKEEKDRHARQAAEFQRRQDAFWAEMERRGVMADDLADQQDAGTEAAYLEQEDLFLQAREDKLNRVIQRCMEALAKVHEDRQAIVQLKEELPRQDAA